MAGFPEVVSLRTNSTAPRTVDPTRAAAMRYYKQGTELIRRRRHTDAEACLRESLRLNPDDPDTLNNLGTAIWEQGRSVEATVYYLRAYQFRPKDFSILNNLGIALWDQNKPDRAAAYYRRALEIWPDSFDAQMNLGVALSDLGHFDEALTWMRCVPQDQARFARRLGQCGHDSGPHGRLERGDGLLRPGDRASTGFWRSPPQPSSGWLTLGDFERGFQEVEWRFRCRCPPGYSFPPAALDRRRTSWADHPAPLRAGSGRHVAVHPLCAAGQGARRPSLGLLPGLDDQADLPLSFSRAGVGQHHPDTGFPGPCAAHEHPGDPWNSAGNSAVKTLSRRRSRHDRQVAAGPCEGPGRGRPRDGVQDRDRLAGEPRQSDRPLAVLSAVAARSTGRRPGVRFISLQKGAGTDQIAGLAGRFAVTELDHFVEGGADRRDFLDTAAIMHLLDLVVTPETAVAHLAGSLGVQNVAGFVVRRRLAMDDQPRRQPMVPQHTLVPSEHDESVG